MGQGGFVVEVVSLVPCHQVIECGPVELAVVHAALPIPILVLVRPIGERQRDLAQGISGQQVQPVLELVVLHAGFAEVADRVGHQIFSPGVHVL